VGSRRAPILLVALGATLSLWLLGVPSGSAPARSTPAGGTLTIISPADPSRFSLDPALSFNFGHMLLGYATCATLMAFRDAPAPQGYAVRPEAAVGPPRVSPDGRVYVFRVRRGLRFSDGSPLTARNFARALVRVLNPAMGSIGADLFSDVRRVIARGDRLRIVLRRPSGDLPSRLALPYVCPVPLGFPVDPAGVPLLVGSGPYYPSRPDPNQLLLRRNRYYRGDLPRRLDRIVINFTGDLESDIRAVEQGRADVLGSEIAGDVREVLARRYGVDKRQFFVERGLFTQALVFNTSSPLFRDNVPLRKAVNLALDRSGAVAGGLGGLLYSSPTDQIVPRRSPGWVDYHLYPLTGPDLAAARRLAAGHLRGGDAVLYVPADRTRPLMAAVIVHDLAKIGLNVQVKQFAPAVMMAKVETRGEPFDMVLGFWGDDALGPRLPELDPPILYPDPAQMIVRYLGGENARKPMGNANVAYFDLPAYDRKMAAANRLSGQARYKAFSRLDAEIMRNQAPWAPIAEGSASVFVSSRLGCFRFQPVVRIVLGDPCLRG
jgi:peptide/nickel transport system substrate-binding protein